jgi:hypothetical protein
VPELTATRYFGWRSEAEPNTSDDLVACRRYVVPLQHGECLFLTDTKPLDQLPVMSAGPDEPQEKEKGNAATRKEQ